MQQQQPLHNKPQPSSVHQQAQIGTVNQLLVGGIASAFSKTCTAPLARLTILFQVCVFPICPNFHCKLQSVCYSYVFICNLVLFGFWVLTCFWIWVLSNCNPFGFSEIGKVFFWLLLLLLLYRGNDCWENGAGVRDVVWLSNVDLRDKQI